MLGYDVSVRPRTTSASTSSHGAADARDGLRGEHEAAHEGDRILVLPHVVGVHGAAGQQQARSRHRGTSRLDLTTAEADDSRLAALTRGHCSIENSVHWVRDMTVGEDAH